MHGARETDGGILLLGQVSWYQTSLQEHVTCVDEFVALQVPDAVEYSPTDLTGMNVSESRGKPQELHSPRVSTPEVFTHCDGLICYEGILSCEGQV